MWFLILFFLDAFSYILEIIMIIIITQVGVVIKVLQVYFLDVFYF